MRPEQGWRGGTRHERHSVACQIVAQIFQVEGTADDTMPHRDIEETKTAEPLPSSPPRPPRSPRPPRLLYGHDRPGTSALFVSLMTAFHWSTATGTMRESTRFGATCSESISTRRHATTTAFEQKPIVCSVPTCRGLVLQSENHYKNHSAKVHKGPF